ncbi:MAG: phosphoenolpyruvate--protein phosphotransferase [Desulfobacterales bacterium]|nr:phosphoenolpyruvate--protein phosphotransferase [Desulfobacterales bacterium]
MDKKDRYHLNLLVDLSDLAVLLTGSENIKIFLQRTVGLIAHHLEADVCSIYLYDEKSKELILKSTIGLNPKAVGRIRMRLGEGLVGTTLEKLKPIREACASRNPNFKYFEEADEERFESFLSVPIQRGVEKIGVLVVQHERRDFFDEIDVMTLRAVASQLAGAIENARLLMDLNRLGVEPSTSNALESLRFIKGEAASGGYAFATAIMFERGHGSLFTFDVDSAPELSLKDFYQAIETTSDQLKDLQARFADRLPESASLIFTAHFMILKDARFVSEMVQHIQAGMPPMEAVQAVAKHYISIFSASPHVYIREKVNDIEDLAIRMLKNLYHPTTEKPGLYEDQIIIARELYPSEILKFASENVKGIIIVSGGVTSHLSILARSMQIPLIIAHRPELLSLPEGTPVLMDAEIGNVYVNPANRIIQQFEAQNKARLTAAPKTNEMLSTTQTLDGERVHLYANINLLSELCVARDLKAEGIGLYRTEFPFLIRPTFPSEEEQYLIYKRLFDVMIGKPIVFRTLDIGGDKVLSYSDSTGEPNPELGLRSIRFSLRHRDIFEQQLRAILRAAAEAENVRIMFPMISSLDEFRQARQVVLKCLSTLAQENLPHHLRPAIGMMIELPAVIEIIDEIVREADFLSIGTNDFIQYMLAADRTNEKVADYYKPYHPSVLRGLAKIVKAALRENKDISICGEMAHDLKYIPFLLGIGIRSLSLDPQFLPTVQKSIHKLRLVDAQKYAAELLSKATLKEICYILNRKSL